MPFTIAHAAAARPLWRLSGERLVLSALAVGSMAPDFEYLVHLTSRRTIGHTLLGVVLLCLPASLAVLAVWHRLVGPAVARLLPPWLDGLARACSQPFAFGRARRFSWVCLSVVFGSLSHLAWDAFTHRRGDIVLQAHLLRDHLWAGGPPIFKLLQYASGVMGMILLFRWASHLQRRPGAGPSPARVSLTFRHRAWAAVVATAGVVATANALRLASDGRPGRAIVVAAVLGSMTGGTLALLGASLATARRPG